MNNNKSQKIREKRILKILKKEESDLTIADKTELAYYKRDNGQKVTYDEFVLMLHTNDELMFQHKDIFYEIVHDFSKVFFCINVSFQNGKCSSEKIEEYSSIVELLEKAKIGNKFIKDVWDDARLN